MISHWSDFYRWEQEFILRFWFGAHHKTKWARSLINSREMQGPLSPATFQTLQLHFPYSSACKPPPAQSDHFQVPSVPGRFTTAFCVRSLCCQCPASHLPGNSHGSFMAQLPYQRITWPRLQRASGHGCCRHEGSCAHFSGRALPRTDEEGLWEAIHLTWPVKKPGRSFYYFKFHVSKMLYM